MAAEATSWYALLKDFQALLGTLVGFGGVCLTLWVNARLADKKRADELDHDRSTIRAALASELGIIQSSASEWKEVIDEIAEAKQVALPRAFDAESASRAYRTALTKIGLLGADEIRLSILAYSQYETLSKLSHEFHKTFGSDKPDKVMEVAFQAYQRALDKVLSAATEAQECIIHCNEIAARKCSAENTTWFSLLKLP